MKLLDLIHELQKCDCYDYCKLETGEFVNDIFPGYKRGLDAKLIYSHDNKRKGIFVNTVLCDSCSYYSKYGNCDTNVECIIVKNGNVIFITDDSTQKN